ncbi:MAG: four helix bundle protein [Candidatus Halalkalibacterium sp. M3_1C_030]
MLLKLGHKKLTLWVKILILVKETYNITKHFPLSEKYGLTNQMRRSVISVASNISEGASLSSKIERKRFYEISRSSLVELDTQFEMALVLNLIKANEIEVLSQCINEVFAMISAMIKNT